MPGFLTDTQATLRAKGIFRPAATVTWVPLDWQVQLITDSNALAWNDLLMGLCGRGYTLAQLMAWDVGSAVQGKQFLYYLGLDARMDLKPEQAEQLAYFDCRKWLANVAILIDPVTGLPLPTPNWPVSTGRADLREYNPTLHRQWQEGCDWSDEWNG